jgi:uncharacterized protein DUF4440
MLPTRGSVAVASTERPGRVWRTLPASTRTGVAAATEEILAIERARNEAILRGDSAALAVITSDDYTFITLRGELRTKAEIVQGFASYRRLRLADHAVARPGRSRSILSSLSPDQGLMPKGVVANGFTRVWPLKKSQPFPALSAGSGPGPLALPQ